MQTTKYNLRNNPKQTPKSEKGLRMSLSAGYSKEDVVVVPNSQVQGDALEGCENRRDQTNREEDVVARVRLEGDEESGTSSRSEQSGNIGEEELNEMLTDDEINIINTSQGRVTPPSFRELSPSRENQNNVGKIDQKESIPVELLTNQEKSKVSTTDKVQNEADFFSQILTMLKVIDERVNQTLQRSEERICGKIMEIQKHFTEKIDDTGKLDKGINDENNKITTKKHQEINKTLGQQPERVTNNTETAILSINEEMCMIELEKSGNKDIENKQSTRIIVDKVNFATDEMMHRDLKRIKRPINDKTNLLEKKKRKVNFFKEDKRRKFQQNIKRRQRHKSVKNENDFPRNDCYSMNGESGENRESKVNENEDLQSGIKKSIDGNNKDQDNGLNWEENDPKSNKNEPRKSKRFKKSYPSWKTRKKFHF